MSDLVLTQINNYCKIKDFNNILELCKKNDMPCFGMFLSTILRRQKIGQTVDDELMQYHNLFSKKVKDTGDTENTSYKVSLLCNWTDSLNVYWSKMIPQESNIILTNENPDYWVIINKPPDDMDTRYIPERTIVFQMEPHMDQHPEQWGEWSSPDPTNFLKVFTHKTDYNNIEWHLELSADDGEEIKKNPLLDGVVSTVLSDKYYDPGHIKRVNFVKWIENITSIDVYGDNTFVYKSYKGFLLYHNKNDGLFPYKYHFNAENHSIPNYFTEKIVDAILSECLCFYWGCPNISEYIDPRAYIVLDLDDILGSLKTVQDAITNDEWGKRIDVIRAEKKKIMKEKNIFVRIEKLFKEAL